MAKEREVKFYITGIKNIQKILISTGAEIIKPRVFESNLRYDLPDRSLSAAGKVLRLRQDNQVRLTYKDRASSNDVISEREELEVVIDDLNTASTILTALGYEVSFRYEKYRTTYQLHNVEIDLDEMPFGYFLEIEGPDVNSIMEIAELLKLNWSAHSTISYMGLFEKICSRGVKAEHLTFEQFKGMTFTADDFGLLPGESNLS